MALASLLVLITACTGTWSSQIERTRLNSGDQSLFDSLLDSTVKIDVNLTSQSLLSEKSIGTGLLLPEGHIITNAHTLRRHKKIGVMHRGKRYGAKIMRIDTSRDLALLRIQDGKNSEGVLPRIEFETRVELAEPVFCIGFPVNEAIADSNPTITGGVISATGRTLKRGGKEERTGLIQTDAVAYEGNSGGPVVNASGRVVGLVAYIFSLEGTWSGGTFAIPSSEVLSFLRACEVSGY
jgi:S1-C subfamily serine protease